MGEFEVAIGVMPFSEPYLAVYDEAILPALTECGFAAQRADQKQSSTVISQDIHTAIAHADLVIVEASEPNKNVYYELGWGLALKKEVILLARDAGALPFDTKHLRHLVYRGDETTALKIELTQWLRNTVAFARKRRRELPRTLNRGDLLPDICDATFLSNRMPIDPQKWRRKSEQRDKWELRA